MKAAKAPGASVQQTLSGPPQGSRPLPCSPPDFPLPSFFGGKPDRSPDLDPDDALLLRVDPAPSSSAMISFAPPPASPRQSSAADSEPPSDLPLTPVAGHPVRDGLIEHSTRADGDGFPLGSRSDRPAGPTPAGVTTQRRTS